MYKCKECGIEKPKNEYAKAKTNKNSHRTMCKICRSIYAKRYYEENKERLALRTKEYLKVNREKIRISRHDYYEKNKKSYLDNCKKYYKKNTDKINKRVRISKFLREFNLTIEQYDDMYIEQGGCCAICGTHQSKLKKKLSVDHDHETKRIRGLLCNKCNTSLGLFEDSIDVMASAISYLKQCG